METVCAPRARARRALRLELARRAWARPERPRGSDLARMRARGAQAKVFERVDAGTRKVVLATNVAETSITIDDVTCVIDFGRVKEMRCARRARAVTSLGILATRAQQAAQGRMSAAPRLGILFAAALHPRPASRRSQCCRARNRLRGPPRYDAGRGIARLQETWVSRAAAEQRRGRAGRVRPGVCFRLFSRRQAAALQARARQRMGAARTRTTPSITCKGRTCAVLRMHVISRCNLRRARAPCGPAARRPSPLHRRARAGAAAARAGAAGAGGAARAAAGAVPDGQGGRAGRAPGGRARPPADASGAGGGRVGGRRAARAGRAGRGRGADAAGAPPGAPALRRAPGQGAAVRRNAAARPPAARPAPAHGRSWGPAPCLARSHGPAGAP